MGFVAFQRKVLVAKSKQVLDRRVQVQPRERIRRAARLLAPGRNGSGTVRIAEGMKKSPGLVAPRHHQRKHATTMLNGTPRNRSALRW